jgi:signal peptide peptidase SppA
MKFYSKAKMVGFIKKYEKGIWSFLSVVIFLVSVNIIGNIFYSNFFKSDSGYSGYSDYSSDEEESGEDSNCNVKGLNLHGEIFTYNSYDSYNDQDKVMFDQVSSEELIFALDKAQNSDNIKAVIVEIDSPGGSPVAGEELADAFKKSKKPVIAVIRERGLSAAYMAASGAETIFASKFSDVGSIGVTMSYVQEVEKNKKAGLEFITLSSGKYKDSGSPERALSKEEKDLFMRDINIIFENFVKLVAENRKLSEVNVRKLADGSSMLGEAALKNGLIDQIGLMKDAEKFISKKIGEKAEVCW